MQITSLAEIVNSDTNFCRDRSPASAAVRSRRSEPSACGSVVSMPFADRRPSEPTWLAKADDLEDLEVTFDPDRRILWQMMAPEARPSFTPSLLHDMNLALDMVQEAFTAGYDPGDPPIRYLVLGSRMPGIFNLGGDLPLFFRLIENNDRDGLRQYAHACIDVQYRRAVNVNAPICTIALVQGDALGGGFEAALAHDVIIAERSAKFGLPEVLFNLFPGMGAYSFLARRLDGVRAERMMLSGDIYSADQLHEMGVVDMVVDDGDGLAGVNRYIVQAERVARARLGVLGARRLVSPVTRQELIDVTDLWVETALTLSATDLRKMKHLIAAQDRRWSRIAGA